MPRSKLQVKSKTTNSQRSISSFFSRETHGVKCENVLNKSSPVQPDDGTKRNSDSSGNFTRRQSPRKCSNNLLSTTSLKRNLCEAESTLSSKEEEPHGMTCDTVVNKSSPVQSDDGTKRNSDSLGTFARRQSPRKYSNNLLSTSSFKRKHCEDESGLSSEERAESSALEVSSPHSSTADKVVIEMHTPDTQSSKKAKHHSPRFGSPEIIPRTPEEPSKKKTQVKVRKSFPFSVGRSKCDVQAKRRYQNPVTSSSSSHDDVILARLLGNDDLKLDLQPDKASLVPDDSENGSARLRPGSSLQQSEKNMLHQICSETSVCNKFLSASPSKLSKESSDHILASILQNSPTKILQTNNGVLKPELCKSKKKKESLQKSEFLRRDSKVQPTKNLTVISPGKKVKQDGVFGVNTGPLSPIEPYNDEVLNNILASISPVKTVSCTSKRRTFPSKKSTEENKEELDLKEESKNICSEKLKGSPSKSSFFGKALSHRNTETQSPQNVASVDSEQFSTKHLNRVRIRTSPKVFLPGSEVCVDEKTLLPLQQENLMTTPVSKYPPLSITTSCQSKNSVKETLPNSKCAASLLESYKISSTDFKPEPFTNSGELACDTSEVSVDKGEMSCKNVQITSPTKEVSPVKPIRSPLRKSPRIQKENIQITSPTKEVRPVESICSPLRRSPRIRSAAVQACSATHKLSNQLITPTRVSPSKAKRQIKIAETKQSAQGTAHGILLSEHADCADLLALFTDDDHDDMSLMAQCGEDNSLFLDEAKRCEVLSIEIVKLHHEAKLILQCPDTNRRALCIVRGCWLGCPVSEGDIVTIEAVWSEGQWLLNNEHGLLVIHPDTLISGTAVVGSMFCARRSVLSSLYRGMDMDSPIMVIGSLVHELLQTVLRCKAKTEIDVKQVAQELLKSKRCIRMLYAAKMTMPVIHKELNEFVPKIVNFISTYVREPSPSNKRSTGSWLGAPLPQPKLSAVQRKQIKSENWNGKIVGIRDIEENLWEPSLGVKGMVDVSVDVEDNVAPGSKKLMPLELKTGRASFSAEHRGQVTLYSMMMSKVGPPVESGLLLYLREGSIREIHVSHREKKDLIMLRNTLAHYLLPRTPSIDPETDTFMPPSLPEPISFGSACEKCPYLTLCSAHLQQDGVSELSANHPMVHLSATATQHLSKDHVRYVVHWAGMLQLEDMERMRTAELRHIWCLPPVKREKNGRAIVNLHIQGNVTESAGKYSHTFVRQKDKETNLLVSDLRQTGLSSGDFIIISTDKRLAVDHGSVVEVTASTVTVLANRDLRKRNASDTFHLDASESNTLLAFNLTNLGCLLDDSDSADRLRQIIIEKCQPMFDTHIDKKVLHNGERILCTLNAGQRQALLRAMQAERYLLIKGMPGTGKTATMVALVQLLVSAGQSVLVTSHTHAAVDNVLLRLKGTGLKLLRLGPDARIHSDLLQYSEANVTRNCRSPEDMDQALSAAVVGVTCLGAGHALLARGRMFDVCLVDESTQVLQPSVLRPLFSSKRFVLVGDPNQLPPLVRSHRAQELGLGESLFARLDSPEVTVTLSHNYRMNRVITELANGLTYDGDLLCGNEKVAEATLQIAQDRVYGSTWLAVALSQDINHSVVFIDTRCMPAHTTLQTNISAAEDSICTNQYEVDLTTQLLRAFTKGGVSTEEIGVMAPYRAQVARLTQAVEAVPTLKGVEVNTVDQFQGRDKQVVIYSCTRSGGLGSQRPKEQEILNDHRRLTVAVTRAKHKLVILGDTTTLQKYAPFKKLLSCLTEKQIVNVNS